MLRSAPMPRLRWASAEQITGSGGCNAFAGRVDTLPPPPANQLIHVIPDKPVPAGWNMLPVWVEGVMAVGRVDSEMGVAGYQLRGTKVEEYQEPLPE